MHSTCSIMRTSTKCSAFMAPPPFAAACPPRLNHANVDEVFSIYGSPIFCGSVPQRYQDAASVAIQQGQTACPAFVPPVGVTVPAQFFVPPAPNASFGTPRTMLNPRQLQFAAKLTF